MTVRKIGCQATGPDDGMGWAIIAIFLFVFAMCVGLADWTKHYYDDTRPPADFNVSY